jgi:hypothetical protein
MRMLLLNYVFFKAKVQPPANGAGRQVRWATHYPCMAALSGIASEWLASEAQRVRQRSQ